MEGRVRVDGAPATKAGQNVRPDAKIEVAQPRRFVSRGGEKLEHALIAFEIDVTGLRGLDVGASTGGFTDCLLQRAVASVVAVDVGYGQLDWRLRNDPRVTVMERTNFRHLPDDAFPQKFDITVIDASFISLALLLPRVPAVVKPGGICLALVKPQFEVGRGKVGKGGIVRDKELHREAIDKVAEAGRAAGLNVTGECDSPIRGREGNQEFFLMFVTAQ